MAEKESDFYHVLPKHVGGGPHGLGDPDDKSLRKVEREIVIPQLMKKKAKETRCAEEVKVFGECAKDSGLMLPFKCRKQAEGLKVCLSNSYQDPVFIQECTQEYLQERTEYRKTGIGKKWRKAEGVIS